MVGICDKRGERVEVVVEQGPRRSLPARTLVIDAAVAFLRSQEALLREGLEQATDDTVVERVTARHDASHESWISTIATLRRYAPESAVDEVIALYGFHGRVAGGLAGERSLRLEGPIETGVRRILADQLDDLTAGVEATLRDLGD